MKHILTVLLILGLSSWAMAGVESWQSVGGIVVVEKFSPPPTPPGPMDWGAGGLAHPDDSHEYGKYRFPDDNGIRYVELQVDNSIDATAAYITQTYTRDDAMTDAFHSQQFISHALPTGGATGVWVKMSNEHGDVQYWQEASNNNWTDTYININNANEFTADYTTLTVRIGVNKDAGTTTGMRSVLLDRCFIWDWTYRDIEWANWDFEYSDNPLANRVIASPDEVPPPPLLEQGEVPAPYVVQLFTWFNHQGGYGYSNDWPPAPLVMPVADVIVTCDPDDQAKLNDGAAGAAIQLTFTPADANVPQIVTIRAVDDMLLEGPHTTTVTHSASSTDPNYAGALVIPSLVYDILDTWPTPVVVTPLALAVAEEGPTTDDYTVVLTGMPSGSVVITVDPEEDIEVNTAGEGNPIYLTFTTLNWQTAQTVTVKAIDDALSEGPEDKTIAHSASGGGYDGVSIDSVTVTVTDKPPYCGEPGQPWLDADIAGPDGVGDANRDCYVNVYDFAYMASQWLLCNDRFQPECIQW